MTTETELAAPPLSQGARRAAEIRHALSDAYPGACIPVRTRGDEHTLITWVDGPSEVALEDVCRPVTERYHSITMFRTMTFTGAAYAARCAAAAQLRPLSLDRLLARCAITDLSTVDHAADTRAQLYAQLIAPEARTIHDFRIALDGSVPHGTSLAWLSRLAFIAQRAKDDSEATLAIWVQLLRDDHTGLTDTRRAQELLVISRQLEA